MCKVQAGEAEAAALITIVGLLLQGHKAHKGCSTGYFFDCLRYLSHTSTLRGGRETGETEPG